MASEKKGKFWQRDWFFALLVAIAIAVIGIVLSITNRLDLALYDWGVRQSSKVPSDKIAIIAIDETSIANIGRWPWPRDVHTKLLNQLAAGKPKVIGHTVFFTEPQDTSGLKTIDEIDGLVRKLKASPEAAASVAVAPEWAQIETALAFARSGMNVDAQLAASVAAAGNVVLPSLFDVAESPTVAQPDKPLPANFQKHFITGRQSFSKYAQPNPALPLPALADAAAGVGALVSDVDVHDASVRGELLTLDYFGTTIPSLALSVAAKTLNIPISSIKSDENSISLGGLNIPVSKGVMRTHFYPSGDKRAFSEDSFFDVYSGKIKPEKYAGKTVLIGATADGIGNSFATPVDLLKPVRFLGHNLSSILQQHYYVQPWWATLVPALLFLVITGYLAFLLPRLKAMHGALVTGGVLIALIITHYVLMTGPGIWIPFALPILLLGIGHLLLTTRRFLFTERVKEKAEGESAESNRMLGLAFQQQGQLDMAFDKFRRCPFDDQVAESIYSLALDFERKRQFNKAESCFGYIQQHDPQFRDVGERVQRAKQMSETIILGGSSGARTANATLLLSGAEKPMLGRYQVEKELGKGAMGVVYQGKDPTIGRIVAIKTMALANEFEGEELKSAKDRFFREAATAGTLNHPNIVTIYDAGEEHDLAYIAMEYIKGHDLVVYTNASNLMPLPKVLWLIEKIAEALDFAHKNNVVHRDIKPANIMYEPEKDMVKVMDFGIARVTDSSSTKTGMVLGTPSYMSPEQLTGKKIDGRSDLFSLGVTLFQLSCGRLPFEGESMTQLMFKIANEQHPNILQYRPDLPIWMPRLIDKALAKDLEKRFQSGLEFAAAIRKLVALQIKMNATQEQAQGQTTTQTAQIHAPSKPEE